MLLGEPGGGLAGEGDTDTTTSVTNTCTVVTDSTLSVSRFVRLRPVTTTD